MAMPALYVAPYPRLSSLLRQPLPELQQVLELEQAPLLEPMVLQSERSRRYTYRLATRLRLFVTMVLFERL